MTEPSSPTPTRTRVRAKVWGTTDKGVVSAKEAMAVHPSRYSWEIVDTETSTGAQATVRLREPGALAYGMSYGWAWAVFVV